MLTAKQQLKKNATLAVNKLNQRKTLTLVSNCCGAKLWSNSTICPKCKEWCRPVSVGN